MHADAEAAAVVRRVLRTQAVPTEPEVAHDVLTAVPDDGNLVVSSSMPIRDVEWFGAPRQGVRVFANRGANGIDGVVSTAVGVALASAAPTVLLIGDVALLHDSSALVSAQGCEVDLTVVVADNRGNQLHRHRGYNNPDRYPGCRVQRDHDHPRTRWCHRRHWRDGCARCARHTHQVGEVL